MCNNNCEKGRSLRSRVRDLHSRKMFDEMFDELALELRSVGIGQLVAVQPVGTAEFDGEGASGASAGRKHAVTTRPPPWRGPSRDGGI